MSSITPKPSFIPPSSDEKKSTGQKIVNGVTAPFNFAQYNLSIGFQGKTSEKIKAKNQEVLGSNQEMQPQAKGFRRVLHGTVGALSVIPLLNYIPFLIAKGIAAYKNSRIELPQPDTSHQQTPSPAHSSSPIAQASNHTQTTNSKLLIEKYYEPLASHRDIKENLSSMEGENSGVDQDLLLRIFPYGINLSWTEKTIESKGEALFLSIPRAQASDPAEALEMAKLILSENASLFLERVKGDNVSQIDQEIAEAIKDGVNPSDELAQKLVDAALQYEQKFGVASSPLASYSRKDMNTIIQNIVQDAQKSKSNEGSINAHKNQEFVNNEEFIKFANDSLKQHGIRITNAREETFFSPGHIYSHGSTSHIAFTISWERIPPSTS